MASTACRLDYLGRAATDCGDAALPLPRPSRVHGGQGPRAGDLLHLAQPPRALHERYYHLRPQAPPGRRAGGDGQRQQGRGVSRGDSRTFRRATRARFIQPARPAGVAGTDRPGPSAATTWPSRPTARAARATWCRTAPWRWRKSPACPSFRRRIICSWKIQLKSWDRFQIPLPFSRCELELEKPIRVPREASDADREALRQQLERTLREITHD